MDGMDEPMPMAEEPEAKRSLKKDLLQRLSEGVVVGDGGMIWTMQQRGYASAGFTPEAAIEHRDTVLQVHREFIHNGADVLQACTFWSARAEERATTGSINRAACEIVMQAASGAQTDVLIAGGVTKTESYENGAGKDIVQAEFQQQLDFYMENTFDFVVAEYLDTTEETSWAVEVLSRCGKPVMATVCIGPEGDIDGVSPQDCAVRLAQAGAHVVGVNCRFGPTKCLETVAMMKQGLEAAGMNHIYLAVQPFGYHTPDAGLVGYQSMYEFPFALDARTISRTDAHKYAVDAFNLGVRYIGGCCGFEPRHIRAMSEALQDERGIMAPVTQRYGTWLEEAKKRSQVTKRDPQYWLGMEPATGRPKSSAMSGVKADDAESYLRRVGRGGQ
ncbi:betaine--homocysteine S-methyltransferase 1-like [Sycon ciliatum]|uniref:betaine--homocysteine S-methyltransferase 1-like n=1 Tax=Sycon ciliatum TaxID=27933 RepID=UPI0020A8FC6B|eukprot:scpid61589/ scgid10090/ Betaine--homocysteine S-methyltransferase 1